MESIEIEGASIEEAVERACNALNTNQENLHYEIIRNDEGAKNKRIKIVASKREEGSTSLSDLAVELKEKLERIVKFIDEEYSVNVFEYPDKLVLNVMGDGSGLIIGKKGQTLDALQHVMIKIAQKHSRDGKKIIVDTEKYREKRIESVKELAKKLAEKVIKTGKALSVNPMSSFERRIVHLTLDTEKGVITESQGEGPERKVVIKPAGRKRAGYNPK